MAAVRIEEQAFSDTRYDALASLAGLADADHARGKMARLWRQCTVEGCHLLTEVDVIAILGPNGVEAIIRSRLAERVGDDEKCIRIKGTEGRIEWLETLRQQASTGGKTRARSASRKAGRFTKSQPSTKQTAGESPGVEPGNDQAKPSALAPALAPKTEDKDIAAAPPVGSTRPRDELWDAIVFITGSDQSMRGVAGHIGKVKKELQDAVPSYTAAEVLSLPSAMAKEMPWAAGRTVKLGEIAKNIGMVRSKAAPIPRIPTGRSSAGRPDFLQQGQEAYEAKTGAPS